jgi:hypothetical protein
MLAAHPEDIRALQPGCWHARALFTVMNTRLDGVTAQGAAKARCDVSFEKVSKTAEMLAAILQELNLTKLSDRALSNFVEFSFSRI